MDFHYLSKSALIAYERYYTLLLNIKDNDNLKTFLNECKIELKNRK